MSVAAMAEPLNLQVTLASQDPDPVEPGQIVELKIKIENLGAGTSDDVLVEVEEQNPFSLYNDVAVKNIGKLRANSDGSDAVIVEYDLRIDDNAVEGETEIIFNVLSGPDEDGYEFTLNVDIRTHDAILDITSIEVLPGQIPPGQDGRIKIFTKNLADSLLKDIKFDLDFTNVPLAPYQSSSQRQIAQLQTNHQLPLTFSIIAEPDATPGLYKIPMNISYYDESGTSYTLTDLLAVPVGETPKLRSYIKKSSVLTANSAGKLTIELANAGTTDIKFVEMTILDSDNFELVSTSNYYYLGDVDSDDTESEEIDVFVNRKVDLLQIPLQLNYYDANNNPYEETVILEMDVYSKSQLKKFGLISGSKFGTYLIIILILGGGFWYYRKRKKQNGNGGATKKKFSILSVFKK